jgi:aldehyde dehydrogenase (NAD+)
LIIAPWNYPFQLALCPLVSAVAAGNQVVLKPSELTGNTAAIIENNNKNVPCQSRYSRWCGCVQTYLHNAGIIFFYRKCFRWKIVAQAAAEHLTPVTLELGGKKLCIIDETANLKLAEIVWENL